MSTRSSQIAWIGHDEGIQCCGWKKVDMADGFEAVRAALAAAAWPGVEEGSSYGTPALKVKGKFLCRLKEPGVLVIRMELDEKEMRMQAEPDVFFETDHYTGWPAVLVRLDQVDQARLCHLLEQAWRMQAPKKLLAVYEKGTI